MQQDNFFFSIVIPAHNEENYIVETLENIKNLNYPQNKYEAIVVENGSSDKTFKTAKKLEQENILVFSSTDKGVSKARNFGSTKVNKLADWVIFLDADSILKTEFLNDLNLFLQKNSSKNFVIGTTAFRPIPETKTANFWFSIYNFGHKILKASFSLQIAKYAIVKEIQYNETMSTGEDLKFIKDACHLGRFFFLNTKSAFTSTRRFTEVGWFKLFFIWVFVAILPVKIQKKLGYNVSR